MSSLDLSGGLKVQEVKWTGVSCPWGEVCVGWNVHGPRTYRFWLSWSKMSEGWYVHGLKYTGVKCPWGEVYRGWRFMGWTVTRLNVLGWCLWGEMSRGWIVPGLNVYGVKCIGLNRPGVLCPLGEMSAGEQTWSELYHI